MRTFLLSVRSRPGGELRNRSSEQPTAEELRRTKRAALHAAYEEAARDRAFQQRMAAVSDDFRHSQTDGLEGDA
jgi:hypothetical protein